MIAVNGVSSWPESRRNPATPGSATY